MASWNLHLVGSENEETVQQLVAEFVKSVEAAGHKLTSAVLTTDEGTSDVPLTPPESDTPADDTSTDTPPAL